jgi:hypothetical protein
MHVIIIIVIVIIITVSSSYTADLADSDELHTGLPGNTLVVSPDSALRTQQCRDGGSAQRQTRGIIRLSAVYMLTSPLPVAEAERRRRIPCSSLFGSRDFHSPRLFEVCGGGRRALVFSDSLQPPGRPPSPSSRLACRWVGRPKARSRPSELAASPPPVVVVLGIAAVWSTDQNGGDDDNDASTAILMPPRYINPYQITHRMS